MEAATELLMIGKAMTLSKGMHGHQTATDQQKNIRLLNILFIYQLHSHASLYLLRAYGLCMRWKKNGHRANISAQLIDYSFTGGALKLSIMPASNQNY